MKILYKNMGFFGGAPKSLLEYIKIAQNNKIEVVAVGEDVYNPVNYKKNNIKLIDLPYFRVRKPIKNFNLLMKYLKIIKDEKPNIIHATTSINCCFHTVIEKITDIPVIYNIPGGVVNRTTAQILNGKNLLVYSNENKLQLMGYGHDGKKIKVISNRIDTIESNDNYVNHYIFKKNEEIRFLLTSRMTDNHYNSINFIIEQVYRLNKDNLKVKLDILGDGKYFSEFNRVAKEINQEFNEEVIQLHGFVNNVKDYILKSHVVFGKGRSVLDGILNNRISFVVNENNKMSQCNINTFDDLRIYNFAGRNIEDEILYEDFREYISDLSKGSIHLEYIPKLKDLTKEFYDIKYAEKEILDLYSNLETTNVNYSPNLVYILKEFIFLYMKFLKAKFTK